ncbi:hypothetical protein UFOVP215_29 [uncultured Caudovirales phage]|uniref:Uncharacterized protein n=1 Tax=uncultured Caudovirales phage TaxID=2100421 RepID=A0A6J7WQ42_9CAUD|nr:hypothetical protein UFOVP215_29 [uncultured Caudovirales phage]
MQPKEIIEKLRLTFNELVNNQPADIQLMKAKLADGTEVEVTDLVVGGIVTIQGVPAPVGEHQLEDGTTIVVGDNGAITEIKPAMAEEPPMQEDMATLFSAFQTSTNEKFAAYEQRFSDYEAKLNKANSIIDALLDVTKTLAETPTGTPDAAAKTQNNFKVENQEKNYSILFS